MTTKKTPAVTTPAAPPAAPDVPREDSEDAFKRFLEEVELDADDEKAIKERIERYRESIDDHDPVDE